MLAVEPEKKGLGRRRTGWICPRNWGWTGTRQAIKDEASRVEKYAEMRREDVNKAESSIAASAG
jgi:hypothetical protein